MILQTITKHAKLNGIALAFCIRELSRSKIAVCTGKRVAGRTLRPYADVSRRGSVICVMKSLHTVVKAYSPPLIGGRTAVSERATGAFAHPPLTRAHAPSDGYSFPILHKMGILRLEEIVLNAPGCEHNLTNSAPGIWWGFHRFRPAYDKNKSSMILQPASISPYTVEFRQLQAGF